VASAKSDTPLFRDFAETWFAERRIEWRRSYADTMRITLDKYLLPTFGDTALDLIEKADIMAFRAGLADRPASVRAPSCRQRALTRL
jgi:integrase